MEDYIKSSNWSEPSPIGGNYDWFYNGVGSGGIVAAVSITSYTSGDDPISKLDEIMDDGNLGTGIIQKNGGAVIYIIE
jgi:hypothetical protein